MQASRENQPRREEGRLGTAIDALLDRFGEPAVAASGNRSPVTISERALATAIEFVFGLFLLSGMGFAYLGRRAVGWIVLLVRLAALYVAALIVGSLSSMLGLLAGLVVWALLPVASPSSCSSPRGRLVLQASAEVWPPRRSKGLATSASAAWGGSRPAGWMWAYPSWWRGS